MHSAPMLAPKPIRDALHHAQWQRTISGYVADAVEPLAMFAVIILMYWGWSRGSQKGFLPHGCRIWLVLQEPWR